MAVFQPSGEFCAVKARRSRYWQFAGLCATNEAAVAALYWNQALVTAITVSFPQAGGLVSLIPLATLAGYATGVAIIAFGPSARRRVSIEGHLGLLAGALVAAGLAPGVPALALASFFVGGGAAVAQRLLANAARLGGPAAAGTAVGTILCAALAAVLGVRLIGDTIAAGLGWRLTFGVAAACVAGSGLFSFMMRATHEGEPPAAGASGALCALWRSSTLLRWATFQQAALFAAYNAAWMTALVGVPAAERSLVVIGGSGAGMVAAIAGGRLTDRLRDRDIPLAGAACVLVAAGVLLPAAYGTSPGLWRVACLLPGMALLDAGLQVALVANQARVQALLPALRSRLAATLTVCGSLGGGVGAGGGYWLWQRLGWPGAIGLAALAGLLGVACSLLRAAETRRAGGRATEDHPSALQQECQGERSDGRSRRPGSGIASRRADTNTGGVLLRAMYLPSRDRAPVVHADAGSRLHRIPRIFHGNP